MENWNSVFADENFWVLYYRVFLKKPGYGFVWNDSTFSELIEKIYSTSKQTIVLNYPRGYSLQIVFSGDPDTGNTDKFLLSHPSYGRPFYLGEDSPHFSLPIFRWEEVVLLIDKVDVDFDPKYVPLLLFKTAWATQGDDPLAVAQKFHFFSQKAGVFSGKTADFFLDFFGRNEGIVWERDNEYGWVNNGEYSLRKKTELNKKIRDFLGACGG